MPHHEPEDAVNPAPAGALELNPVTISVAWWVAWAKASAAWGLSYPID